MEEPKNDSAQSFKIGTEKLESEFQCTVCLNPIDDAYVTRCGHVFCKGCIAESIGRHHRCPFCNQELKDFATDAFKNYHFNAIKKIVEEEKKIEADKYLKKVFGSDALSLKESENAETVALLLPIEKVRFF